MDDITATGVSLGGLTVGLIIVAVHISSWYFSLNPKLSAIQGVKSDWKGLLFPFLPLMLFGSLIILSAGGYIADIAGVALWGSNEAGGLALERGMGGTNPDVTRTNNIALDDGGRMVVLIILAILIVYYVKRIRGTRILNQLTYFLPIVCGIALGLSDGYAGWFSEALAPAVDSMGGAASGVW